MAMPIDSQGNPFTRAAFAEGYLAITEPAKTPFCEPDSAINPLGRPLPSGDTWDTAWRANGSLYAQMNDGYGWSRDGLFRCSWFRDMITRLDGDPNRPESISGENLVSVNLPQEYATSLYELNGALYHINVVQSADIDPDSPTYYQLWWFYAPRLIKSLDGGLTWFDTFGKAASTRFVYNSDGTVHAPMNQKQYIEHLYHQVEEMTFRHPSWSMPKFVKYGQNGVAPDVSNAQMFAYIYTDDGDKRDTARFYLARIPIAALDAWTPENPLRLNIFDYFIGGDGMLDSAWGKRIEDCVPFAGGFGSGLVLHTMAYNERLRRYVMAAVAGGRRYVLEAGHPWGPWTVVLDEASAHKEENALVWPFFMQNFMSGDGKKMWLTTSPHIHYTLGMAALYLDGGPDQAAQPPAAAFTELKLTPNPHIEPRDIVLKADQQCPLTVRFTPASATNIRVTLKSSDPTVASVNPVTCIVTAHKTGAAAISAGAGSMNASIIVRVE
jgi:hypothetical protein